MHAVGRPIQTSVERHDSPDNAATALKYPAATVLTCLEVAGYNLEKQVISEGI
jgi:hypothetical protein